MSNPKKFKGNQATYNITFEGIGITIENVLVKEIGLGAARHMAVLDEQNGRWKLLTTPGYLLEPLSDEPQIISFDRTDPDNPKLINAFAEDWEIAVHTILHLPPKHKLYSIDQCDFGMRIQYTSSLISAEQHDLITRIIFEKVSK